MRRKQPIATATSQKARVDAMVSSFPVKAIRSSLITVTCANVLRSPRHQATKMNDRLVDIIGFTFLISRIGYHKLGRYSSRQCHSG